METARLARDIALKVGACLELEGVAAERAKAIAAEVSGLVTTRLAESEGAPCRDVAHVTADGLVCLPTAMRIELGVGLGAPGRLWFLRGRDTWEAWPEEKLAAALAEDP